MKFPKVILSLAFAFAIAAHSQTVTYEVGSSFCGPAGAVIYNGVPQGNFNCNNMNVYFNGTSNPGQPIWLDASFPNPGTSDFIAWRGSIDLPQALVTKDGIQVIDTMTLPQNPPNGQTVVVPTMVSFPFTSDGYTGNLTLSFAYSKRTGRYGAGYNVSVVNGTLVIASVPATKASALSVPVYHKPIGEIYVYICGGYQLTGYVSTTGVDVERYCYWFDTATGIASGSTWEPWIIPWSTWFFPYDQTPYCESQANYQSSACVQGENVPAIKASTPSHPSQ